MSSRALRKLYSDPAVAEIEEDEVEETDEPQFVSCSNKFLMVLFHFIIYLLILYGH